MGRGRGTAGSGVCGEATAGRHGELACTSCLRRRVTSSSLLDDICSISRSRCRSRLFISMMRVSSSELRLVSAWGEGEGEGEGKGEGEGEGEGEG